MAAAAPPRRRFRLRRLLKWSGTALSALLFVAIGFCLIFDSLVYSDGRATYGLFAGAIGLETDAPPRSQWTLGSRWTDWKDLTETWKFWIHFRRTSVFILWVPLWIPFVVIDLPTTCLWFLDRRRPNPGACRHCNYNLTSNTSGVCPKCGQPAGRTP